MYLQTLKLAKKDLAETGFCPGFCQSSKQVCAKHSDSRISGSEESISLSSSSSDWSAFCSLSRILWHSKKRILSKKCQWVDGGGCPENRSKTLLRPSLLVLENAKTSTKQQKNPQTIHAIASVVSVVFEGESLVCRCGVRAACPWCVSGGPWCPCGGSCPCWLVLGSGGIYFSFVHWAGFIFKYSECQGFIINGGFNSCWIQSAHVLTLPVNLLNLVWPIIIPVPCLCLQHQGIFLHLLAACLIVL